MTSDNALFPRTLWNFVELYVRGKSSGTLWNFLMGLMGRNNYGVDCLLVVGGCGLHVIVADDGDHDYDGDDAGCDGDS